MYNVNTPAKFGFEVFFDIHDAEKFGFAQSHDHVHIAFLRGLVAGDGAKYPQSGHAIPAFELPPLCRRNAS